MKIRLLLSVMFCTTLFVDATAQMKITSSQKHKGVKKETISKSIPLNQIQVIGSHNSYKQPIDAPLFEMLKQSDSTLARHIEYSHISLSNQLSLGLRNLEIDVYADAEGGKYAHPKGLEWEKGHKEVPPYDPEGLMTKPGFKVFHIQDIDFRSSNLTFEKCLQELKAWSEANKDHTPVFITLEAKDNVINRQGFTVPEQFTANVFDQLDKALIENLGKEHLITPDDVRGSYKTLEGAVLNGNWPSLEKAKGKFIFVLDDAGAKRETYIQGHPSLQGRVLFANAEPGTPEAAFLILNDPVKDQNKIQQLVKKGYLIRTRADADTKEARSNDMSKFEAACQSGAQIITTDYYAPSTHFKSDYSVSFSGKKYFRVNPLFTAQ
ncbi:phosphatidylinositol-specific phospholipase C1-like protein [Pontibacter silvestris]|uniref:Phosphatidylinositol-specific phospholipase C1-like protein n=1 Tax=Pontibacter silvestris TaxID=2305183 RepID=A0ABW4X4Q8_9BACT|nr:phosphatidylinositol-specific phospholipase C1-like protein [Pontibacter silvestris]MCC9135004.1 phosphatidylinositol-specific phospholipase C1-like protein [Pontibacter silvestris]